MEFELDHVILWTAVGAPEASQLVELGFAEGTPNTHLGQGTANRRFFFRNAYLELLWVHDLQELQSSAIRRLGLWERWSRRRQGTCPFGICFRSAGKAASKRLFSAWEYRPPYLPKGGCIQVGLNSDNLAEPMLFCLDSGGRPDAWPQAPRQPLEHIADVHEITRVRLILPDARSPSVELRAIVDSGLASLEEGVDYLLELGFDTEIHRQEIDFRPALPLIFHR